jgi:hypothetical protein
VYAQDGPIKNRMGHNFPKTEMLPEEMQRVLPKNLQKQCRYVIACVKGNAQTLRHELCHARCAASMEVLQRAARLGFSFQGLSEGCGNSNLPCPCSHPHTHTHTRTRKDL